MEEVHIHPMCWLPKKRTNTAAYAAVAENASCLFAPMNIETLAPKSSVEPKTVLIGAYGLGSVARLQPEEDVDWY